MSNVCTWPSCKCTAKGQCEGLGCRILAPTFTAADLEKLANAVWSEYHSSLEEKWTFRKEHVLNAMIADLAQRVKGPAHD